MTKVRSLINIAIRLIECQNQCELSGTTTTTTDDSLAALQARDGTIGDRSVVECKVRQEHSEGFEVDGDDD